MEKKLVFKTEDTIEFQSVISLTYFPATFSMVTVLIDNLAAPENALYHRDDNFYKI